MAIISIPTSIGGVSIPGSVVSGPLGALFGNKYGRTDLSYPRDLGSASKQHYVTITIIQKQPAGYTGKDSYTLNDAISGAATNISNITKNTIRAAGSAASAAGLSATDPSTWSNLSLDSASKIGGAAASQLSTELEFAKPKEQIIGSVSLYMPDTIQFSYNQNYNEVNMTDIIKDTLDAVPVVGKNLSGAVDSDITKLISQKGLGLAVNPNQQLLFDGIGLRTYQMAFTFTPYSKAEATAVKNIIDTIKKNARPQTVKGSGGMLFIPPCIFQPTFMFGSKENIAISKVGPSVIETIDVNYSPNGFATHTDGTPVQIQLTLSFKEIELVDKDKIEKGL